MCKGLCTFCKALATVYNAVSLNTCIYVHVFVLSPSCDCILTLLGNTHQYIVRIQSHQSHDGLSTNTCTYTCTVSYDRRSDCVYSENIY